MFHESYQLTTMKRQLLTLFLILPFSLLAQNGIIADLTGLLSSMRYTNDSLVAPTRQGGTTIANELSVNACYQLALKNPRISLRAGLGYTERNMRMNKTGLDVFFVYILSFGSHATDSFPLNSMQLRAHYLDLPVACLYTLTKEDRALQIQAGVQLNPAILLNSRANLTYDPAFPEPTGAQRDAAEKRYTGTTAKFILGIQPRIDLKFPASARSGFLLNLVPVHLYTSSWNNKITTNSAGYGLTIGLYYHL